MSQQPAFDQEEYLAICSHDLRSPMSMIILGCNMLLGDLAGPLDDEKESIIQRILNQANYANDLINDVLEMAKLEGGIELRYTLFDVEELLEKCLERHDHLIRRKNLKLHVVNYPYPIKIMADFRRMEQVLDNLISNAIRHAKDDGGVIRVSTSWLEETDYVGRRGYLQVSIWNNGTVIDDQSVETVFEKYATGGNCKGKHGAGLGLAISKWICDAHQGRIWAQPTADGTSFHVKLPNALVDDSDYTAIDEEESCMHGLNLLSL